MLFRFGPDSGGEPAPLIIIALVDEITGQAVPNLSAFVDTGADGTILPLQLLQDAGFLPNRQRRRFYTAQSDHPPEIVIGYSVSLHIGEFVLYDIDVYASRTVTEVILGRDVLNQLVFTYDGPQRLLAITNLE